MLTLWSYVVKEEMVIGRTFVNVNECSLFGIKNVNVKCRVLYCNISRHVLMQK